MVRFVFPVSLILAFLLGMAVQWMLCGRWEPYEYAEPQHLPQPTERPGFVLEGALSLQEIVQHLEIPADSRILEVETEEKAGRMLYEIELLMPDGRVLELYVDPYTAEVVFTEYEHGQ
jgi:uncharacterized membrane protein YkoI